jgi:D-alanyl-D-alanine carboxypeptidase
MHSRFVTLALALSLTVPAGAQSIDNSEKVPSDIQAVFNKPVYKDAVWGLRVVDLDTGKTVIDLEPHHKFYIASVRKVFTLGEAMSVISPDHRFNTPVYRQGPVSDRGTLQGNLVLVASGDLTMGGRTKPDGTVAISKFDHNEAEGLGNAVLTEPNPLAGYADLARQIAASGIKQVSGDVVIDDRLFQPYPFRNQFDLKPIFVNDDLVDLIINPTEEGELASLKHRPRSAALKVENDVMMQPADSPAKLRTQLPECIGDPNGCIVKYTADLPVGYTPPLTGKYPLIRAYRITDPSSYARIVLIEELRKAGVKVNAPLLEKNPVKLLPGKDCYEKDNRVALLIGLPFSEDEKFVNKVSYNIGADTSFLLWGLTQGVDNMDDALVAEHENLEKNFGIGPKEYSFVDGSGGGESMAYTRTVTRMLTDMTERPVFPSYLATFPQLGIDGSLGSVTGFESDPTLAGAKGQVKAKTGTYVDLNEAGDGLVIKCQGFGGYIQTSSGKRLVYHLVVNGIPSTEDELVNKIVGIFQDEGLISAILWRDN